MRGLHLDQFMRASEDFEGAQYRILSGLQHVRDAFARNVIYPHLGALVSLYESLNAVLKQMDALRSKQMGTPKHLDLEASRIVYEKPPLGPNELAQVEDLIRWALPLIQEALEEGRTIFEFVEEHLHLEEVGIVPAYMEEGYLILPDGLQNKVHILQFTLSVFTKAQERFRSLRTSYVKSIPQGDILRSPQSIKLDLLSEKRELPNPATYCFITDIDFPYEPTILPIAKRKLMQYLAAQGGTA